MMLNAWCLDYFFLLLIHFGTNFQIFSGKQEQKLSADKWRWLKFKISLGKWRLDNSFIDLPNTPSHPVLTQNVVAEQNKPKVS